MAELVQRKAELGVEDGGIRSKNKEPIGLVDGGIYQRIEVHGLHNGGIRSKNRETRIRRWRN